MYDVARVIYRERRRDIVDKGDTNQPYPFSFLYTCLVLQARGERNKREKEIEENSQGRDCFFPTIICAYPTITYTHSGQLTFIQKTRIHMASKSYFLLLITILSCQQLFRIQVS